MNKNLLSLGLLRNGKVYATKQLAIQGLTQSATNDGVAKLARYLEEVNGSSIIRTVVGFYANADEMEDSGGGQSSYTILDIDGDASDIKALQAAVEAINDKIGEGVEGSDLTTAINDINAKLGSGFTSTNTVAKAIEDLGINLTNELTIAVSESSSEEYAKVYTISQGGTEVGVINIPKDMVISSGSVVNGYWSGDTFTEDEQGPDKALKLVLANAQSSVIYINIEDLIDIYTPGNGISIENNEVSINLADDCEPFLTVSASGLKLYGVQAAIDNAKLIASDGINILGNNKIKAVAAQSSADGVENPIVVDGEGIKLSAHLDCGFFDYQVVVAETASDIANISDPSTTDLVVSNKSAVESMNVNTVFNSVDIKDASLNKSFGLAASDSITVDNITLSGTKDGTNAKVLFTAPEVTISNATVAEGSTIYNVFEGAQNKEPIEKFVATNITVSDPALVHNVLNIYRVANDAEILVKDSSFNLNVDNSNVLRLTNNTNSTGVTVTFKDVDWTYENGSGTDFGWAGLIIYQPFGADAGVSGDLSKMTTWKFVFDNCRYNGVKVTANNFGSRNQVFYLYNVGNTGGLTDPVAEGFNVVFK